MANQTVHIKPRKGAKVVGDATFRGIYFDSDGKALDYKKKAFVIPGNGMVYDPTTPEGKVVHAMITCKALRPVFNPSAKIRYRFDIVNLQKDAADYLKNDELKTDYKSQVMKMSAMEIRTVGYMFKLGTDEQLVKAGLYKMIDSPDKNKMLQVGQFLNSPSRQLLMWVFFALFRGDAGNKKGLYKDKAGLYYYNEIPIGLGEDNLLAWIKRDAEDSNTVYNILKNEYEDAMLEQNKASGKEN